MIKDKAELVHTIFVRCLATDLIPEDEQIKVEGLVHNFSFHKASLEECGPEVLRILEEMHDTFKLGSGDGWSFLLLPFDKYGNHWCEHNTAEKLVVLGIGLDLVSYLIPRDMWDVLPGGVPYIQLKIKAYKEEDNGNA